MTDKETKPDDLSTASTNDDSPSNDKHSNESSILKDDKARAEDQPKETDKLNEYETRIEKLSNYVIKLKKALEQQNACVQQKVILN